VFNYFPTKEDLFYSRLAAFGDQLVEAIGARPPGAPALADQTGAGPDDIAPKVAANALMGVHRALLDDVRRRVLAGEEPARLAADIRALTRQALALLEHGLGDYGAVAEASR
jgi:AcrR family transcriptional regulator